MWLLRFIQAHLQELQRQNDRETEDCELLRLDYMQNVIYLNIYVIVCSFILLQYTFYYIIDTNIIIVCFHANMCLTAPHGRLAFSGIMLLLYSELQLWDDNTFLMSAATANAGWTLSESPQSCTFSAGLDCACFPECHFVS